MLDVAVRPSLKPSRDQARRRYLTLLFADLTRSTQLGTVLEAEHYAAIIEALAAVYCQVIPRHGGVVARIQGDGVLAVFGHPETMEDDGRRATEAALELHAQVRRLRLDAPVARCGPLTLHSGIHAGLVLVGKGDAVRGRFELMGNTPNVAARLSDAAAADEILVSEETLGPDASRFVVAEQRSVQLGGTSAPVVALRIVERAPAVDGAPRRPRCRSGNLFGRDAEFARLRAALDDALTGVTRRVVLSGAPGVGKTALVHAFLDDCAARRPDCVVLRGWCEGSGGAVPLQPFVQMLRRLSKDASGNDPATPCPVSAAEPAAPLARVGEALRAILDEIAAHTAAVIFIDDWQWADDASHQLLSTVLAGNDQPLLLLLTTRQVGAAAAALSIAYEHVPLSPLSDEDAARLVRSLLPGADPFVVDRIRRHAGGNPLFIEELCHRIRRGARLSDPDPLHGDATWLDSLIESRVARLPERHATLVRSAAVIGNVIPGWLFERVTGCLVRDPRLRRLEREELLLPGEEAGTLRFRHGITRDVIYRSVGLHQRRALHLAIAEALQAEATTPAAREDASEALAYHFASAGDAARAADYAELAGQRAIVVSALDRAQAQYRAALAALEQLEATPQLAWRWNAVVQRLGLAEVFDPSRADLPLFERALALARGTGDVAAQARALYWLGYIHYALGDQRDAVRWSEEALQAARDSGDERLRVQVQATLGQVHSAAGRYAAAKPLLDDAIVVKRSHCRGTGGIAVGLTYSLTTRATLLGDEGDFDAARQTFDDAFALVGDVPHEVGASIHGLQAAVLLWQGRWAEARDAALRAYHIALRVRSLFTLTMGRAAAAYGDWMDRRDAQALQELLDTAEWLLPRGNALFRSLNHGWLADALVTAGRPAEARRHAAQALQRARRLDLLGGAMACRAMARQAAQDGRAAAATRWLARARSIGAARGSAHEQAATMLCQAEVALALGAPQHAAGALTEARSAFGALHMDWHAAQAERLARRL